MVYAKPQPVSVGYSQRLRPKRGSGTATTPAASSTGSSVIKIRWDTHSSTISANFYRMLEREHLVDIALACEGQFIRCHRVVLSACSPYFESVLSGLNNTGTGEMVFFVAGMRFWELRALVRFMYKGEISIAKDQVAAFIQAATDLQVKGLNNVNPYALVSGSSSSSSTRSRKTGNFEPTPAPPPTPTQQYQPIPLPKKYTMANVKQEVVDEDDEHVPHSVSLKDKENSPSDVIKTTLMKIKEEPMDFDEDEDNYNQASSTETLPNPVYVANEGDGGGVLSLESIKTEVLDTNENEDNASHHPAEQSDGNEVNHVEKPKGPDKEKISSIVDESVNNASLLEDDSDCENNTPEKKPRTRTKYPNELKVTSVNDLVHKGIPLADVADKYCVPKKTLSNWKSKYLKELSTLNSKSVEIQKRRSAIATEEETVTLTKTTTRRRSSTYGLSAMPPSLPPIEGTTRNEHLQHAAKLVVDKLTNVRGAALHYGIPRTTLSNYMRRNGLIHLRRGSTSPEAKDRYSDELPDLSDNGEVETPNDSMSMNDSIDAGPGGRPTLEAGQLVEEFACNNDSGAMEP